MKTFYEMLQILEDNEKGLGDQNAQDVSPAAEPGNDVQDQEPKNLEQDPKGMETELKHYMFFSNLNVIKAKAEELLAMDPKEIDAMLDDGHDWASDHISTSRDDIEEVYNWIIGEKKPSGE